MNAKYLLHCLHSCFAADARALSSVGLLLVLSILVLLFAVVGISPSEMTEH